MRKTLLVIITLAILFRTGIQPLCAMDSNDIETGDRVKILPFKSGEYSQVDIVEEVSRENERKPLLSSQTRVIKNLTAVAIQNDIQRQMEIATQYSQATAATLYSTLSREQQLELSKFANHNDNMNGLLAELDLAFFEPKSNLTRIMKGLGGITFAGVPSIIFGSFIVYSLGDLFQLAIDGQGSRALLGTTIAITVPVVARQTYDVIETLKSIFTKNPIFTPSDGGSDGNADGKPHIFAKDWKHNTAIAGGLVISFMRASVAPVLMLKVLARGVPVYPWVAAPGLLFFFWKTYTKRTLQTIRNYFSDSYIESENNKYKRKILISKIKILKKLIKENPTLLDKIYEAISTKINRQNNKLTLEGNEEISAFSTLMVTELVRYKDVDGMDIPPQLGRQSLVVNDSMDLPEINTDESNQLLRDEILRLKTQISRLEKENEGLKEDYNAAEEGLRFGNNYKIDLENIRESKAKKFLKDLSFYVGSMASYAEMEALRYTMQHLLSGLGVNESAAMYSSYGVAILIQILTTFPEKTEREKQYTNLANFWESLKDFRPPQSNSQTTGASFLAGAAHVATKVYSSTVSLIGGFFYALPNIVVANQALPNLPTPSKLAFFLPMFADQVILFHSEFNKNYKNIFTGIETLRAGSSSITFVEKRENLIRWCDEACNLIKNKFDEETIENIYISTQKGA